jgi:hypothetical protein
MVGTIAGVEDKGPVAAGIAVGSEGERDVLVELDTPGGDGDPLGGLLARHVKADVVGDGPARIQRMLVGVAVQRRPAEFIQPGCDQLAWRRRTFVQVQLTAHGPLGELGEDVASRGAVRLEVQVCTGLDPAEKLGDGRESLVVWTGIYAPRDLKMGGLHVRCLTYLRRLARLAKR